MNIGQAAQVTGVTAKMIRYYEGVGLIRQAGRTDAGYRQYSQNEIETLRFIRRARDLGFSLDRIKTLLALWEDRSRKSCDVKLLAGQYIAELDEQIAKLNSIRRQLEHLSENCHGDGRAECPIIDDLSGMLQERPQERPQAAGTKAGKAGRT